MPVLTPVLTPAKKNDVPFAERLAPVGRLVRAPLKVPAWAVLAAALLVALTGFMAGRKHPAHHYVSYFGYPMVLDTTTGKACYAAPPQPSDSAPVQDTAFAPDDSGDSLNGKAPTGPAIPMCGNE